MKVEIKEKIESMFDMTECMIENFFDLICNKELILQDISSFYLLINNLLENIKALDLELVEMYNSDEFLTAEAMGTIHTARASTEIMILILQDRIKESDLYYELTPWIGGLG